VFFQVRNCGEEKRFRVTGETEKDVAIVAEEPTDNFRTMDVIDVKLFPMSTRVVRVTDGTAPTLFSKQSLIVLLTQPVNIEFLILGPPSALPGVVLRLVLLPILFLVRQELFAPYEIALSLLFLEPRRVSLPNCGRSCTTLRVDVIFMGFNVPPSNLRIFMGHGRSVMLRPFPVHPDTRF
jgi:hypothetical protein